MGLFGKLFEKKTCDICGGEIGLLGNKKLEDGNCCKECAGKLSPWFTERRHSTVADIQAQLEYREANREAVAKFNTTRSFGETMNVLLDEDQQQFMVTSARNLQEANPDVLSFSQVTGCDLDITENRQEEMREIKDKDGNTKRVSYAPPRFTYRYDFYIIIRVNHPYFDEIKFKLNRSTVEVEVTGRQNTGVTPGKRSVDYQDYERMGQEIKRALTSIRTQVRKEAAQAAAPKTAATCPYCGATTIPDANGCCEYCGGAMG